MLGKVAKFNEMLKKKKSIYSDLQLEILPLVSLCNFQFIYFLVSFSLSNQQIQVQLSHT